MLILLGLELVLLTAVVCAPGLALERLLIGSRRLEELVLFTLVLGTVSTGTLSTTLAFILGGYVGTGTLLVAALAITISSVGLGRVFGWARPSQIEMPCRIHVLSLVAMLILVSVVHWNAYDPSYHSLYSRCSFHAVRYLLGLPERCRLNADTIAELIPPRSLPQDMAMTCPDDHQCRFRVDLPGTLRENINDGGMVMRVPYFRNAQLGYPVLLTPFLGTLRFMGVHFFVILTRALCALALYVLSRRLSVGHWPAVITATVAMVNPVVMTVTAPNENLYGLLLSALVITLLLDRRPGAVRRSMAAGLVFGALVGVRHIMAASALALPAFLAFQPGKASRTLSSMALIAAIVMALFPYLFGHQYLFGDILTNELKYASDPLVHRLPLLGTEITTHMPLNWPFREDIVRPMNLPFPGGVIMLLTLARMFGILLVSAGVLGLITLASERPRTLLPLALWAGPPLIIMCLLASWGGNMEIVTYPFLVLAVPTACIAIGSDAVVRERGRRTASVIVAITCMLVILGLGTLARWDTDAIEQSNLGSTPPEDRAMWTSIPLFPSPPRPFEALVGPRRDTITFPRHVSLADARSYNDDRSVLLPCNMFTSGSLSQSAPHSLTLPLDGSTEGLAWSFILNTDRIWPGTGHLSISQHSPGSPPFDSSNIPPNLILLESVMPPLFHMANTFTANVSREAVVMNQKLEEVLPATDLRVAVIFTLGDVSASPEMAAGVLGEASPVRLPTGSVEAVVTQPEAGVLPERPKIVGRSQPVLHDDATVVWRYEDGEPLLVRRAFKGRDFWFLNALTDDSDVESGFSLISDVINKIKGGAIRTSLHIDRDTIFVDIRPEPRSSVLPEVIPPITVEASASAARTDVVLKATASVRHIDVSLEGRSALRISLDSLLDEGTALVMRSGDIPAARIRVLRSGS